MHCRRAARHLSAERPVAVCLQLPPWQRHLRGYPAPARLPMPHLLQRALACMHDTTMIGVKNLDHSLIGSRSDRQFVQQDPCAAAAPTCSAARRCQAARPPPRRHWRPPRRVSQGKGCRQARRWPARAPYPCARSAAPATSRPGHEKRWRQQPCIGHLCFASALVADAAAVSAARSKSTRWPRMTLTSSQPSSRMSPKCL